MVDSNLAWAAGKGIWMRWVASRLRRATTASRSAPSPGWGSVFAASTTSAGLAADAFMHPSFHSFAKRDESHLPERENPRPRGVVRGHGPAAWQNRWGDRPQTIPCTPEGRTAAAGRVGTGFGHGSAVRGDRHHLRRRPVRGGARIAGYRADRAAGLTLPAAGGDGRDPRP